MKSIIEQMVDAGYRKYDKNAYDKDYILYFYQKRYKDKYGTKYFITCKVSNMGQYTYKEEKDSYCFSVQFNTHDSDYDTFDVNLSGYFEKNEWNYPIRNLKYVEDFFENIFIFTKAKHNELDNNINSIYYKIENKLKKTL